MVKAVFSFYENLQEKYIDSFFSSLQQLFQVFDFTEKTDCLPPLTGKSLDSMVSPN